MRPGADRRSSATHPVPPPAPRQAGGQARRAAIADAVRPSATPTPAAAPATSRTRATSCSAIGLVSTEVARRAASNQTQPTRLDDFQPRCHLGDRPDDRFELASVTTRVVVEYQQLGTCALCSAAACARLHSRCCGTGSAGDHPIRTEHRSRLIGRYPGSDGRPFRAPHRDQSRRRLQRHVTHANLHPARLSTASAESWELCLAQLSTLPVGPGSQRSSSTGRGMRRPPERTVTRRAVR